MLSMNADLLIALLITGAYFVCERLNIVRHVIERNAHAERVTDEIRHAYGRPETRRSIRIASTVTQWPPCGCAIDMSCKLCKNK